MTRTTFVKIAGTSAACALLLAGCKPGAHVASAGSEAVKNTQLAGRYAAESRATAAQGDAEKTAALAERAVLFAPRNAAYRAQLGTAYLAMGRFRSAATSFADARTLGDDSTGVLLNLALAQIALGQHDAALATIAADESRLSPTDRGLATALAGNVVGALPLLEAAARTPGADARARQNLALGYALAGRWAEAKATAAQDLSASEIDARMAQWAAFTHPVQPSDQVATLLGVSAVEDGGLPERLALIRDEAGSASASAEPVAAPIVPVAVTPDVAAVAPAPPAAAASPADAPVATSEATPAEVQPNYVATRTAEVAPPAPLLLRADPHPVKVAVASPLLLKAAATGAERARWVVQLGAFAKPANTQPAYDGAVARVASLVSYTPAGALFRQGDVSLRRVSLTGFESRGAASAVCARIKSAGRDCFVRAAEGDAPVEWVARKRAGDVQVAAR